MHTCKTSTLARLGHTCVRNVFLERVHVALNYDVCVCARLR
jgi:hypothetical protein